MRLLPCSRLGSRSGSFGCLELRKQDLMAFRQPLVTEWMTESW